MKILKIIGWLCIPYIMIFFQWKKIGKVTRVIGIIWSIFALLIAIAPKVPNKDQPMAVSSSIKKDAPVEAKAQAQTKSDSEAKAKTQADADAKNKAEQEAKVKAEANNPENIARKVFHKEFGDKNSYDKKDSIIDLLFEKENGLLSIEVYGQDNITEKLMKEGMWIDTANALKDLKDNADIKDINVLIAMPLQDKFGKNSTEVVMNMTFPLDVRNKINWDNFIFSNIPNIADNYIEHPVIQKIKT